MLQASLNSCSLMKQIAEQCRIKRLSHMAMARKEIAFQVTGKTYCDCEYEFKKSKTSFLHIIILTIFKQFISSYERQTARNTAQFFLQRGPPAYSVEETYV